MPAGDRNREGQEPEVTREELSDRRAQFLLDLTLEDRGTQVGSGQEFYEFVKPAGTINQKADSVNVLSGERSFY